MMMTNVSGCSTNTSQQECNKYEETHVHMVYNSIAPHFSATRFKPWPVVDDFLKNLRPGSIGLDVGCGNGKYLTVNKEVFTIASDRSSELLQFAAQHQPHSTIIADNLNLPHPLSTFDYIISIAVIHHLSSVERRRTAISKILELLRPDSSWQTVATNGHRRLTRHYAVPGQALFFVWALEQKSSRRGWDRGHEQDVLVPWVLKSKDETAPDQTTTYHRYYHLYREGELEEDITAAGGQVLRAGYDRDNWWAVAQRLPSDE